MRQPLEPFDGGWAVREGWLIVGPKRTLKAGKWRIDIDLLQSPEAIVDLDVVANAGLDVLLRAALCGHSCGSFCLDFLPDHHFQNCESQSASRLPLPGSGLAKSACTTWRNEQPFLSTRPFKTPSLWLGDQVCKIGHPKPSFILVGACC